MTDKEEARVYIARLLGGSRDRHALSELFSLIRFKTRNRYPLVKDLADFMFHRTDKDRGEAHALANHLAAQLDIMVELAMAAIEHGDMPPMTVDQLTTKVWATYGAITDAEVEKFARISKAKAKPILEAALNNVAQIQRQTIFGKREFTAEEKRVLSFFKTWVNRSPPINLDVAFEQFSECLADNDMLSSSARPEFERLLKDPVAVFCISKTHMRKLKFKDGRTMHIRAALDMGGYLGARVFNDGPDIWNTWLMSSSCRAEDWCEPDITDMLVLSMAQEPLEMGPDFKLRRLS